MLLLKIMSLMISLNRTFYGIETGKRQSIEAESLGLNRTFYGIETADGQTGNLTGVLVLIVPFMELKPTTLRAARCISTVLIVPFMELKPRNIK